VCAHHHFANIILNIIDTHSNIYYIMQLNSLSSGLR
jgi:hypothetical protein